ncbi:hypothetical protein D3C86_1763640 [compost metagenome]
MAEPLLQQHRRPAAKFLQPSAQVWAKYFHQTEGRQDSEVIDLLLRRSRWREFYPLLQ